MEFFTMTDTIELRPVAQKIQGRLRKRFRNNNARVLVILFLVLQYPSHVRGQTPSPHTASVSPAPAITVTSSPTVSTIAPTSSIPTSGTSAPSQASKGTPVPSTSTLAPQLSSTAPSSAAPFESSIPVSPMTPQPVSAAPVAVGTTGNPTIQDTTTAPSVQPSTDSPSASPSHSQSTSTPSTTPFLPPTLKPTKKPTKLPSESPSAFPIALTNSPTVVTSAPSFVTVAPTKFPTPEPTSQLIPPSALPTLLPSNAPTNIGTTFLPSSQPSKSPAENRPTSKPFKPTFRPTDGITMKPSINTTNPTSAPSSTPSSSPSVAPSPLSQPVVSVVMLLQNTSSILIGSSEQSWASVTESFIFQSVQSLQPPLRNLDVTLNITSQQLILGNGGGQRGIRRLQQGTSSAVPLQISFSGFLSYVSDGNYEPNALVGKAFNSVVKRAQYVGMLQRTNDPFFANVANVQVLVDGQLPPDENPPPSAQSKSNDFPTAIVAAAAGGGGFLLIVAIVLFFCCRSKKSRKNDKTLSYDASPTTFSGANRLPMATEIVMEPQDEVSTLGDPMYPGPGGMLLNGIERDEHTASITDDYDYTRQYRMAHHQQSESSINRDRFGSVDDSAKDSSDLSKLGLGKMSDTFFSDDASFEEQFVDPDERFEVLAPSGKLGMVIDTPSGGVPVVHAIKENSVLSDTVQVGDRLISVDGDDCTAMTAMQVSKLISLKANNSTRTLVFMRSRANGSALVHD